VKGSISGVVIRLSSSGCLVELRRLCRHGRYGKLVRQRTRICCDTSGLPVSVGGVVDIVNCNPISKTKRHRVIRISSPK